jgi:hypothetical protein
MDVRLGKLPLAIYIRKLGHRSGTHLVVVEDILQIRRRKS